MSSTKYEPKPLKIWVDGEKKPKEFKSSIEALKETKVIQSATSASIEITERVGTEGSTISSKESAGLRNWAIRELQAVAKGNKSLSFMDVKYIPMERKVDKGTGQVDEYPAKLVFRMSVPRDNS
jgi:hypothetical protein